MHRKGVRKRLRLMLALTAALATITAGIMISPTATAAPPTDAPTDSASAPNLPSTVPSLDGWKDAAGSWTLDKNAKVAAPSSLSRESKMLAKELSLVLKTNIPATTDGNIKLQLDSGRKFSDLGTEGFEVKVTPHGVQLIGGTEQGVFYGTRTLSQMLRQGQRTLPAGSAVSVPKYKERGATLCACQINISNEWIEQFLDDMADLHLNQVLLEMKLKSDKHPDTNTWSYYSREDVKKFVAKANSLGIDVIPEINSPGHMNIWLENSPQYQLTSRDGKKAPDRLNIADPKAVQFYKDLIDEYDGVFTTDYWHMGADEYMLGDNFANYPQLTEFAKATYGPDATVNDAFTGFINDINDYVKAKGKKLRIWNDGIVETSEVTLDKDVIIDYWYKSNARSSAQLAKEGYPLMNASTDLYWSRSVPSFRVNSQRLYNNRSWNAGTFNGSQIDPDYKKLLGLRVSIWPDGSTKQTENEVAAAISDSLYFTAQMAWSASRPWPKWQGEDGMKATIDSVGKPLLRTALPTTKRGDDTYQIPELEPISTGPWQLTRTPDSYFQLKDQASGKCLTLRDGTTGNDATDKHLDVVTRVGSAPILAPCETMAPSWDDMGKAEARNTQKWRLADEGTKVTIRSALTNQYLATATGQERHPDLQGVSADVEKALTFSGKGTPVPAGKIAKFPGDLVKDNALFTFRPVAALKVEADKSEAKAGENVNVTVRLTAPRASALPSGTITPQLPDGWKVAPSTVSLKAVPAGKTAVAKFVAQPQQATEKVTGLRFTYKPNEACHGLGDMSAGVEVAVAGLQTVTPKIEGISTDSQEEGGEGPVNGYLKAAFDQDPDTFWHTRWSTGEDPAPHWVVFNAGTDDAAIATVNYLPRQNKPNGRINAYKVYVSATPKQGGDDWGEPVAAGELPNSSQLHRIRLPEGTVGPWVKLEAVQMHPSDNGQIPAFSSAAEINVSVPVAAGEGEELAAPEQPTNPEAAEPTCPADGDSESDEPGAGAESGDDDEPGAGAEDGSGAGAGSETDPTDEPGKSDASPKATAGRDTPSNGKSVGAGQQVGNTGTWAGIALGVAGLIATAGALLVASRVNRRG
ncbi:family 20 glycosylhydrolase [Winkia neuii]|uniref:family 20 glycosylhydrolase n=1 Tax=Winkia neuii TaxID=33007 RepID=UPI00255348E8|nr:family 20 glycosylhydrolase [Winkia neuii]